MISFFIADAFSLVEILYILGNSPCEKIVSFINKLFREQEILYIGLCSFSAEPSSFGCYFAFVYPWLLYNLFSTKRKTILHFLILVYGLILIYLTFSRTAYFIMFAETIVFIFLLIKVREHIKRRTRFLIFLLISIFPIFSLPSDRMEKMIYSLSFSKENTKRLSKFATKVKDLLCRVQPKCERRDCEPGPMNYFDLR